MSLFGSFINDFEEDPIFGHHMRSMRQMSQMNTMMNSMFSDPFGMFNPFDSIGPSALTGAVNYGQPHHRNALMPFGFSSMPNINRLINPQMPDGATSFSSSQVISMTHGPDGRPQIYKATSSTKSGPGGIRETQKTVQDSQSGVKKMAIGHHIGERSHVVERERNIRTGEEAERQDFVNIEEEEVEDFDREFTHRSRSMSAITNGNRRSNGDVPAIMPSGANPSPSSSASVISNRRHSRHSPLATSRRPLRTPSSSPLALPSSTTYTPPTTSIHPHPYNASSRRANRPMKGTHHSDTHRHSPSGSK